MEGRDALKVYRDSYATWRSMNSETKKGFFPVFRDFLPHLARLSGGAVKLYLYLGLHAGNQSGECWPSVKRMASHFRKSERTIYLWLAELENARLIYRDQASREDAAHTFLLPYGSPAQHSDHK